MAKVHYVPEGSRKTSTPSGTTVCEVTYTSPPPPRPLGSQNMLGYDLLPAPREVLVGNPRTSPVVREVPDTKITPPPPSPPITPASGCARYVEGEGSPSPDLPPPPSPSSLAFQSTSPVPLQTEREDGYLTMNGSGNYSFTVPYSTLSVEKLFLT